jgi:YHS domain-containing protein
MTTAQSCRIEQIQIMKDSKSISLFLFLAALFLGLAGCAQKHDQPEAAAIPYPLDTCIVSDEKLDADSDMKPYTFTYEGQEIKLCCKSCLKDFNKEPAKYLAKLKQPEAAEPTR